MKNPQLFTSANGEWETPWIIIRAAEELVGPFDLDACAKDSTVAKAPFFFTPADNGLTRTWFGRTWVNPPYGRDVSKWIERAVLMAENGATVCMVLPCRTDTVWFHDLVVPNAEVRLLRGRIRFELAGTPGDLAPFPTMFAIFGRTRAKGMITTYWLPTEADHEAEDDLKHTFEMEAEHERQARESSG